MTLQQIEDYTIMYNKVKNLVLQKLYEENLLQKDDADEFAERNHVMLYKASWYENWAKKAFGKDYDPNGYYLKIVELQEKEDAVKKMKRRTNSDYSQEDFEVS